VNESTRHVKHSETADPAINRITNNIVQILGVSCVGLKKIKLCVLFSRSPGCAPRLFPSGAFTDPFAEVRNFVGDVGSRLVTAGRCD
jgi:hypothetical protein